MEGRGTDDGRGRLSERSILFLFLVVIYRRYIAQCRLKSVGFTTSRKLTHLEY